MSEPARVVQIAVVGGAAADAASERLAREVGQRLAAAGVVVLCGGRGGVMAAAAAGAREAGGTVVGVLPGRDAVESPPNSDLSICLFTGLGQARNQVLVLSAAAVIAVGGGWGTLSEIASALKARTPVVLLESFRIDRPDQQPEPLAHCARSPAEAVALALAAARRRGADP